MEVSIFEAHPIYFIAIATVIAVSIIGFLILSYINRNSFAKIFYQVLLFPIAACGVGSATVSEFGLWHMAYWIPLIFIGIGIGGWAMEHFSIRHINTMCKSLDTLCTGDLEAKIDKKLEVGKTELHRAIGSLNKYIDLMQSLRQFIHAIGKGDFTQEITPASENDTISHALLKMRTDLVAEEKDRQQRVWATDGVAQFADILRSNNENIESLANAIIKQLVKYTNSNQGGLFIYVDETIEETGNNKYLELAACYAYDRKKYVNKRIAIGDGLVSTCFQEAESIYMTDIPTSYIEITSGLGGEVPSALFLVPLKLNDEVCGVLELASFKPYDDYVRNFIEKVAESIASAVLSFKTHEKTTRLLEQAKIQAEQMASQEEELRQNIEELQSTQEAARSREDELASLVVQMREMQYKNNIDLKNFANLYESLSSYFYVIECDKEGIITSVNDKLVDTFKMPRETMIGQSILLTAKAEELEILRRNAIAGTSTPFEQFDPVSKTTSKGVFIPYMNGEGQCEKMIFVFNIIMPTEEKQ